MGKSSPRYAKLKEGAETACHISLGTIILCANTAVKGSKKLTEIAALAGENISRGTREFAKTAIQKGKIDKQVLDSIKRRLNMKLKQRYVIRLFMLDFINHAML